MAELHPAVAEVLQHFEYTHLPPHLQLVSQPTHALAHAMADQLSGPQLTVGLNKLLEAKDCFVRAAVAQAKAKAKEQRPEWTTDTGVDFGGPRT